MSDLDQVLSEVVGKRLVGELLTIVDAAFSDRVQRDAVKSQVRQSCHKCLADLTSRLGSKAEEAEVGLTTKVEATKVAGRPKQKQEV